MKRTRTAILTVLGDHPEGLYGLDIMKRTRCGSFTLYPALAHLRDMGLVELANAAPSFPLGEQKERS